MSSLRKLIVCILATSSLWLQAADPLYQLFQDPPPEYRPFVRWWWNGARVTPEEATRQLDVLQSAGFGGVEINTIAMPAEADPATLGHADALRWLGPEWIDIVATAAKEARRRNLTADIIIGSGWPFGAEFLEPDDQIQRLRLVKHRIEGPFSGSLLLSDLAQAENEESDDEARNRIEPTRTQYHFLRLVDGASSLSFEPGLELLQTVENGAVALDVPKGEYTLALGIVETGYTQVKLGAPGARGRILDHYKKSAVSRYLRHMSTEMGKRLGPEWSSLFRATFVDSLELDRSNWTDDYEAEFARRRGYEIAPYLPFVLDPERQDEIARRARYDFSLTLIELFDERFSQTYADWCEAQGLGSRLQAYGRETHPLHGSMTPSHPEGETWLWHDEGERARIFVDSSAINKYVSSAAHLVGKRTVSFEAMTNAVPVFRETLGDFKRALDLTLQAGPNHPILHGFNYTPLEAGFPGWVRFGSYLNERNPYWPHMHRFNDYAARIGAVLRNSEYEAQIAVLAPRPEEWERFGLLYQPFPEHVYPWYQYRLPEALQKLGFGVDFVSEEILASAEVDGDELVYNGRRYQALILEQVEAMSLAAARILAQFSETGGRVAFLGSPPQRAPGLGSNWRDDSQTVRTLFNAAPGRHTVTLPAPEEPEHHSLSTEPGRRGAPFDDAALIGYLKALAERLDLEPVIAPRSPSPWVSYVHHKSDDQRDFVFVSNSSPTETVEVGFTPPSFAPYAELWDPETGKRRRLKSEPGQSVELTLPPMGSALVALSGTPSTAQASEPARRGTTQTRRELLGDWELMLEPIDGRAPLTRQLPQLGDLSLSDDPEVANFAGTARYRKTIHLSQPMEQARLSLGRVNGTSRLLVDGQEVGVRWYGHHRYDLGSLSAGSHTIEIEVTTSLGNYARSLRENETAQRWASWFRPIETGLLQAVTLEGL